MKGYMLAMRHLFQVEWQLFSCLVIVVVQKQHACTNRFFLAQPHNVVESENFGGRDFDNPNGEKAGWHFHVGQVLW